MALSAISKGENMSLKTEKAAFPVPKKLVFHPNPQENGDFQWVGTVTLSEHHSIRATIHQSPQQDNLRFHIEHAVNTSTGMKKASTTFEFQETPRKRSQEKWTSHISGTVEKPDYEQLTHWPTAPAGSTQFRKISHERRRVYMDLVSGIRTVMNASVLQGSTNRNEFNKSLRAVKKQLAEHARVLRQQHLTVNRKLKRKNGQKRTATRTAPNKRKSDRRRR
jgi:hypothetical protein